MVSILKTGFVSPFNSIKSATPIKFQNVKQNNVTFKGLEADTFCRQTPKKKAIENDYEAFEKWVKATPDAAERLVEMIKNPNNELGSGFTHTAYNFDGNDNFVLRVRNNSQTENIDFKNAQIKDEENKDLTVNVGQKIGKVTIPTETPNQNLTIEILKKQLGHSLGNPPIEAIIDPITENIKEGELHYHDVKRKENYLNSIQAVAGMPVSAYEDLILTAQKVADSGYAIDIENSNNLLIDEENQKINIIDVSRGNFPADFGGLLFALTNIDYFDTFISDYENTGMSEAQNKQAIKDTMEITKKYTQAMKNLGVKFDKNSYKFFQLLRSLPMSYYFKTADIDTKLAKLKEEGLSD